MRIHHGDTEGTEKKNLDRIYWMDRNRNLIETIQIQIYPVDPVNPVKEIDLSCSVLSVPPWLNRFRNS